MKNDNISLVKITVMTVAIGLISPSVDIQIYKSDNPAGDAATAGITFNSLFNQAYARGGRVRAGGARINTSERVSGNVRMTKNVRSRNGNLIRAGKYYNHGLPYYYSDFYTGGGYYIDGNYHSVEKKRTSATLTNLPVGAIISPAYLGPECVNVNINSSNYQKCGDTYFKPFFQEGILKYKVIASP